MVMRMIRRMVLLLINDLPQATAIRVWAPQDRNYRATAASFFSQAKRNGLTHFVAEPERCWNVVSWENMGKSLGDLGFDVKLTPGV